MSTTKTATWKTPDERIAFDCHLQLPPEEGRPSFVTLRWGASPERVAEFELSAQNCLFSVRAPGVGHAAGWLRLEMPVSLDGRPCAALFGDFRYGDGGAVETRFEGMMVAIPLQAPPPPPPPLNE